MRNAIILPILILVLLSVLSLPTMHAEGGGKYPKPLCYVISYSRTIQFADVIYENETYSIGFLKRGTILIHILVNGTLVLGNETFVGPGIYWYNFTGKQRYLTGKFIYGNKTILVHYTVLGTQEVRKVEEFIQKEIILKLPAPEISTVVNVTTIMTACGIGVAYLIYKQFIEDWIHRKKEEESDEVVQL